MTAELAAPSEADFSTARLSLDAALPLLDAFNRRNKNQHRSNKWWARFGMLRRAARKLHTVLCATELELDPSREALVFQHAEALRDRVIPPAYT
jgi:hypothetical protein